MKIARRLKITKVDLCRRGANQDADVMLFKSADHPDDDQPVHKEESAVPKPKTPKTVTKPEDLAKATPEQISAYVDHLEKTLGDAETEVTTLQKTVADMECADDDESEPDADDAPKTKKKFPFKKTVKTDELPDAVQKRLDAADERVEKAEKLAKDADERIAKAEARAELVELRKTVEADMPKIPGTVDEVAKMLQEAKATLTAASYTVLEKALKAGSAAIAKAEVEVGSGSGAALGTALEEINKRADELVEKGTCKTRPEAVEKVAKADPALYSKYKEEKRTVRR